MADLSYAERLELARLRLLDDHSPNALAVFDGQLRLTFCNRAALALLQRPASDLLGKAAEDLGVAPHILAQWQAAVSEGLRTGTAQRFDYDSVVLGTQQRRLEAHVVPLPPGDPNNALMCILRDVTDLHAATSAMRDTEERFRILVELSPDLVLVHDGQTILFMNQAGAQLLGAHAPAELIGMPVRGIVHPEAWPFVQERIAELLEGGGVRAASEGRFRRVDGSTLEAEVVAAPVSWQGRRAIYVIARDLTDRKRATRQVQESQARMAQAQKMDAVGKLAGGIAHDFNNLLTVILAQCDFIRDASKSGADTSADLLVLQRAAERGARLINQLLSFARRQVNQPEAVDLTLTLTRIAEMLRHVVGPEIEVVLRLPETPQVAHVDPGHLEQVVLNLAFNARDAMPRGGVLTLEAQAAAEAPGLVALAVTDTGVGMTPEVKRRLFEPFFTTKSVGQGSGLGLASAAGIVEQSGGHIEVETALGKGSRFTLFLPRSAARAIEREAPPAVAVVAPGSATVLVAEDDVAVRHVAVRALTGLGFRVLEAASGEEALRVAQAHGGDIDLLLTDLRMPQMAGEELAQRLRQRWPGLPVLFCSGHGEEHPRLAGGAELLAKPYVPAELLARVTAALGQRR